LLYPKKNIYEKGPGSVYQAGAAAAGPSKPLQPAAPQSRLVYHKHSCAVVVPYDDEEDVAEPDDDFTVPQQHQGDTSDEEE
jgi:hypothetical protein